MKHTQKKIANKLIIGFITLTTLSSLITGLFYLNMFYQSHMDTKATSLLSYAHQVKNFYTASSTEQMLELYDTVLDARIWIIKGNEPPIISTGHHHQKPSESNCHSTSSCKVKGYDNQFINQVLEGNEVISKSNNEFYYGNTLSVGIPIIENNTVAGAILIHAPLDTIYAPIIKAAKFLLISILISVLLTFILARKYAIDFTSSIRRIQSIAARMMTGNYDVRTKINRLDEIGDLSASLDNLALKLQEASLESANLERSRQDFVANVSHEFRTPLTIIKGNTEALIDGMSTSPETTYNNILKETLILESLVTDLLDLSQIEQDKLELHIEEIALHEVIRDATRSIRQIASTKDITLDLTLEDYPHPITTDYLRIRQILIIFLDNAVKYTPPQGTITINLTIHPNHLELTIQDTGIGISPQDLEHIWDRFYKADKARQVHHSSGLGLSIAKRLLQLLDIDYTLTSTLGTGTTVTLHFKIN